MDLERYADEYKNVSKRELAEIREFSASDNTFESKVRCLNMDREMEKIHGKEALRPGPLVHVLSVRIQPRKDVKKSLVVYGRISVEHFDSTYGVLVGHDLYKRDPSLAEVLDSSGTLTLNGPDFMCHPDSAIIPMFRNKINAELFDEHGNVLAQGCFSLDDTEIEGGYEQVKSMCIPCEQVSLFVAYIAIPFGYSCRLKIRFCSRKVPGKQDSVSVNGKIVASCINTYGNYSSEECVLFQKHSDAFERVEIDGAKMLLSRCWVALPAYSSLVIGVNLSEFDTGRKIVNGSVQLLAEPGLLSGQKIILDDMYIQVSVAWFPPTPLGRHEGYDFYPPEKVPINVLSPFSPRTQGLPIEEIDEMDTKEDDETSSHDESLSNPDIHWELRPHRYKPFSSPAIEIFSIFIGREESKAVKLHGSIEVFSEDKRVCYLFKRDENDPLFLSEHMETALVPDGSRLYENYNDLEIKFDMKDIGGNVAVKGYAKWDAEILDEALHRDKQLCSFLQGEQGFLALHWSIFSHAVVACPKIFLILKTPSSDVYPKVYGSLTCQYRNHCYSSKYNRDYYRSVLFTKTRGDAVQLNGHGLLPLCRSSVVIPSYSPLIINLDLSIGMWGQKVASVMEIEIGDKNKTVETSDSILCIECSRWHDYKVLSTRIREFLISCPPTGPSPPVAELVIATADFQRDLMNWNISHIKGGVDAKELFHLYIVVWIKDKRAAMLEKCKLDKVKWSGVRTQHCTTPFVDEMYDRIRETLNDYEVIICRWPEYTLVLENGIADVEKAIVEALDKQYSDVLAPLKDNLTPKKFGLKYVQKLVKQSVAPYVVPDELGILLNSIKRMLDVLRPKIEAQFKSWGACIPDGGNQVPGERLSEVTVMLRAKFRNYVQAVVEKLVENTRLQSATKLKKILQDSKISIQESDVRNRMQPLREQLTNTIDHLHSSFETQVFIALCRGYWDRMGKEVLSFLENRKENKSWYKGCTLAVSILDDTFASQMQQLLGNALQEKDIEPPRSIMEVRSMVCKDNQNPQNNTFYY